MKICCLQLEPQLGKVQQNIDHATEMIALLKPEDVDVLVLPEMAFSGYVFKSKDHIRPYLEDTNTGPTVTWAKAQAVRLNAHVVVGYPERRVVNASDPSKEQFYNSIAFVSPTGELLTTYAKHFLYYTDENWAEEGPAFESIQVPGLGKVGFGICMDLNPYRFQAAFQEMEFATFHLNHKSDLILCSMAWNKDEEAPKKEKVVPKPKSEKSKARLENAKPLGEGEVEGEGKEGKEDDTDEKDDWEDEGSEDETEEERSLRLEEEAETLQYETVQYWALRMSPFYDQKSNPVHEAHIVISNRIGTEGGNLFVGSSCVMKLSAEGPRLYGVLPSNAEGLLKVKI